MPEIDEQLDTPTLKLESVTQTSATLSWTAVENAEVYVIYRSRKSNSGFAQIAQIEATEALTWTDESLSAGADYYYKIEAQSTSYLTSEKSGAVKATTEGDDILFEFRVVDNSTDEDLLECGSAEMVNEAYATIGTYIYASDPWTATVTSDADWLGMRNDLKTLSSEGSKTWVEFGCLDGSVADTIRYGEITFQTTDEGGTEHTYYLRIYQKADDYEPIVTVDLSSYVLDFDAEGGEQQIMVTTTGTYGVMSKGDGDTATAVPSVTAKGVEDWLSTVTLADLITVSVGPNYDPTTRNGTVFVSNGDAVKNVTVRQKAAEVAQPTVEFAAYNKSEILSNGGDFGTLLNDGEGQFAITISYMNAKRIYISIYDMDDNEVALTSGSEIIESKYDGLVAGDEDGDGTGSMDFVRSILTTAPVGTYKVKVTVSSSDVKNDAQAKKAEGWCTLTIRDVTAARDPSFVINQRDYPGIKYGSSATVYNSGCGLCSFLNAYIYKSGNTKNVDDMVKTLAAACEEKGVYTWNGVYKAINEVFKDYFDVTVDVSNTSYTSKLRTHLLSGGVATVCAMNYALYNGNPSSSHYMAVVNIRQNEDGEYEYLVLDSYTRPKGNKLGFGTKAYGWVKEDVLYNLGGGKWYCLFSFKDYNYNGESVEKTLVTDITLSSTATQYLTFLDSGATYGHAVPTVTVAPSNATNTTVTWCSTAPSVAKVDATTGVVTAVSGGTAEIFAKAADGSGVESDRYTVTVVPKPTFTVNGVEYASGSFVEETELPLKFTWKGSNYLYDVAAVGTSDRPSSTDGSYTTKTEDCIKYITEDPYANAELSGFVEDTIYVKLWVKNIYLDDDGNKHGSNGWIVVKVKETVDPVTITSDVYTHKDIVERNSGTALTLEWPTITGSNGVYTYKVVGLTEEVDFNSDSQEGDTLYNETYTGYQVPTEEYLTISASDTAKYSYLKVAISAQDMNGEATWFVFGVKLSELDYYADSNGIVAKLDALFRPVAT